MPFNIEDIFNVKKKKIMDQGRHEQKKQYAQGSTNLE